MRGLAKSGILSGNTIQLDTSTSATIFKKEMATLQLASWDTSPSSLARLPDLSIVVASEM